MTNTGFVALPILRATYGAPAVLPAAIATVFVAVVMFPAAVLMQELDPHSSGASDFAPAKLARHVMLNPMVLSTLVGIAWAAAGVPMPGSVNVYLQDIGGRLDGLRSLRHRPWRVDRGLRSNIGRSAALAAVKLALMPLIVLGLSIALGLEPLYLIAAVVCAAVPTAKTVYILSGEYHCEQPTVAATISLTTLCSVGTLMVWIYILVEVFSVGVRRRPPTFENLL